MRIIKTKEVIEGVLFEPFCYVYGDVSIGKDSSVCSGAVIKGDIKIGKNVQIKENCVIVGNGFIGDNVVIGAGCKIDSPQIESNVILGENTVIRKDCHIGEVCSSLEIETPTIISECCVLKSDVQIFAGAQIDSLTTISSGVVVGWKAKIEPNTRLKKYVFPFCAPLSRGIVLKLDDNTLGKEERDFFKECLSDLISSQKRSFLRDRVISWQKKSEFHALLPYFKCYIEFLQKTNHLYDTRY